jgi:hypothetical protein
MSIDGEFNPAAILTDAEVREIKALYLTGEHSYTYIAAQFGVHKSTVQQIINCVRWDHLLEPEQPKALERIREQRRNNHNLKHRRLTSG